MGSPKQPDKELAHKLLVDIQIYARKFAKLGNDERDIARRKEANDRVVSQIHAHYQAKIREGLNTPNPFNPSIEETGIPYSIKTRQRIAERRKGFEKCRTHLRQSLGISPSEGLLGGE